MSAAGFLHRKGNERIGYQEEVAPTIISSATPAVVYKERIRRVKDE